MGTQELNLTARVEELERRLRRFRMLAGGLLSAGAVALAGACTTLNAQPSAIDGVIRARGIVITDANGVERIHIGSPVPDPPGEGGTRIAEGTGMIIHDENGRERFGLGYRTDGWTVMGFDAAPGNGTGNRERLHLGVDGEGRGFVRFLDRTGGLAGRMHLTGEDALATEYWKGDAKTRTFKRSTIDVQGWRALPDYVVTATSR